MKNTMKLKLMDDFVNFLKAEEKSENTICKYVRDIRAFFSYMGKKEISKDVVLGWKSKLIESYAPASVNSMLAAVNSFLDWLNMCHCKVKPIKIQREIFIRQERELTHQEYLRLIKTANNDNNKRLALLLQTIGATGIRVSELQFITVQSLNVGRATISCKGKTRVVFLSKQLCIALKKYCREENITGGVVFRTKSGKPLDRSNIWKDMKALCNAAGVDREKVFPHNLRHLFARTYYKIEKDLSRLADLLGHSNINTTRIYTAESGSVHEKQLARMQMLLT